MRTITLVLVLALAAGRAGAQERPLRVVASLPTYAAIAREVVGDRGTVASIAEADEEPHFVQPKPSFLPLLARADVFITTGLDLELWVPALLDKAGNPRIMEGQPGYVAAYPGIRLLEVPTTLSRTEGDIHVHGNPHIHTDPVNVIQISRNVRDGVARAAPQHAAYFRERQEAFERRLLERLYGAELVRLLTPDVLFDLARTGEDWRFIQRETLAGAPLAVRLGGWLKEAEVFRGAQMVCYHKEWVYFSERFGLPCVEYVEPKPGIPPSPRHVQRLIERMRRERIGVVFSPNYFDRNQIREIAARTGARAVVVPAQPSGAPGVDDYEDLVDTWIGALREAFEASAAAGAR
jgi:ABC-type Zn uptake system ZnuABC Zn-binding protein ZnuA